MTWHAIVAVCALDLVAFSLCFMSLQYEGVLLPGKKK